MSISGLRHRLAHGASQPQDGSAEQPLPQPLSQPHDGSEEQPLLQPFPHPLAHPLSHPQEGSDVQHLLSQPHPFVPSIRLSKSKPKLWVQRLKPSTSVPAKRFHFIEPCLLMELPGETSQHPQPLP